MMVDEGTLAKPDDGMQVVVCKDAQEKIAVLKFVQLWRRCRNNGLLTVLRESGGARWWVDGQPAGILKSE